MIVEMPTSSYETNGTDIYSGNKLPDLEYTNDFVFLSKYLAKSQVFLDCLKDGAVMLGMSFGHPEWKTLLLDWVCSKTNFVIASEVMGEVNRLTFYLGSKISPGGRVSDEVSS